MVFLYWIHLATPSFHGQDRKCLLTVQQTELGFNKRQILKVHAIFFFLTFV